MVAEIDEIDDVALSDTVDQIADRAAQLQTERQVQPESGAGQIAIAGSDHADDQHPDEHEERGLILQQPKGRAAVLDVGEAQVVADNRQRYRTFGAAPQLVLSQAFGQLIQHDHQTGQAKKDKTAQREAARSRLAHFERRNGVAHADFSRWTATTTGTPSIWSSTRCQS